MTILRFTPNLIRHVESAIARVEGETVEQVYRHVLDVSSDGERVAFGSTTGSLWVSEDQGDSWQAVSEHLPPVLCVQFEA